MNVVSRIRDGFLALGAATVVWAGSTADAAAALTVTPITWDVVGLDSNRPLTAGPQRFPVAARVCTDTAATNLSVSLVWDDANTAFIDTRPGSLDTLDFVSLAANSCADAYFEIEVTRDVNAFGETRPYHILATADAVPPAS